MDNNHKYSIQKGIPVIKREGLNSKYGFSRLEIGDSIFIPDEDIVIKTYPNKKNPQKGYNRNVNVQTAASYYARRKGIKLATRKIEGGIRIWRIE